MKNDNPLNVWLQRLHTPLLEAAMRWRGITIVLALLLLAATAYPLLKTGSEFMPPLDEGDILYMPTTYPGISITKAKELLQQTDKILKTFPEVEHVFGKVGRANTATDPAPLSMIETTVRLKPKIAMAGPRQDHQGADARDGSGDPISRAWPMPGPIRSRRASTCSRPASRRRSASRSRGADLDVLEKVAGDIEKTLKTLPDTLSAFADKAAGGYYLDFDINREEAARYGLTVGDVQDVVQIGHRRHECD